MPDPDANNPRPNVAPRRSPAPGRSADARRGSPGAPAAGLAERFRAARTDPDLVVIEGFHALKHAVRFGARVELAVTSDPDGVERLAAELAPDLAGSLRALVAVQPAPALRELVPRTPHTKLVAVARAAYAAAATLRARPAAPVVLLEDPRHLGNVGAAVRVAAAAGAAAVLTTGPRDPWDPAALRGSAGLHFALPVVQLAGDELLPLGDRPLVALTPGGEELAPGAIPRGAVLAFGTERHGLSDALLARADARVRMPMRPGVSSLNLATAVAAVLYGAVVR